ncbi:MAG: hypothetical protein AAF135_15440 [Bacteroidota bacterium]
MMDMIPAVQVKIQEALRHLYQMEIASEVLTIQEPKVGVQGDFTLRTFSLAQAVDLPVQVVSQCIGQYLAAYDPTLTHWESVDGFLNLTCSDNAWRMSLLEAMMKQKSNSSFSSIPLAFSQPEWRWFSSEIYPIYQSSLFIRQYALTHGIQYFTIPSDSLEISIQPSERLLLQVLARAYSAFTPPHLDALPTYLRRLTKVYKQFFATVPILISSQSQTQTFRFALNHVFGLGIEEGMNCLIGDLPA